MTDAHPPSRASLSACGARLSLLLALPPLLLGANDCQSEPTPIPETGGVAVHGRAMVAPEGDEPPLFLPDLTISLVSTDTADVRTTTTDVHGRYRFLELAAGSYQVCWEGDGFVSDCQADVILIEEGTAYPPIVEAQGSALLSGAKALDSAFLLGQVALADGTSCFVEEPFFETYQNAEVSVLDLLTGLPIVPSVRTNSEGYYVLPTIPLVGSLLFTLQARCGGGVVESLLDLTDVLLPFREGEKGDKSGLLQVVDLTLDNSAPTIGAMWATSGGVALRQGAPGAAVQVNAQVTDVDGGSVSLTWMAEEGGGTVVAGGSGTATWTLPTAEGRHSLHLLAEDGDGGVARASFALTVTTDADLGVSGAVVTADGEAIVDAEVRLDGVALTVDASGTFSASAAPGSLHLLEVRADGYLPSIQHLDGRAVDLRVALEAGTEVSADPTAAISLSASAAGSRVAGGGAAGKAAPQAGSGGQIALTIPANALVDGSGAAPRGPVRLTVAGYDPTVAGFPTDAAYVNGAGEVVRVRPFGGVSVTVTSPDGKTDYNLVAGQSAQVRMTIPDAYLAQGGLPGTAPVWLLNEEAGVWEQEGTATRDGDAYVFAAPHFSLRSVGMAEGPASCVRVRVDDSIPLPVTVEVRVPIDTERAEVQRFTLTDPMNALHHLPRNRVIDIVPLDRRGNPREILRQVVDTGDPIAQQEGGRAAYPYAACKGDMRMKNIPEPHGFHSYYLFLNLEGRPDEGEEIAQSQAYYDAVDPTAARATLGGWWARNGFDAQGGSGGTRGVFYNANELAYWRDMNCLEDTDGDVACWVAKHWDGEAAALGEGARTDEVVAMEWRALNPGEPRTVTFAAYNGGGPDAPRVTYADFDGLGNRFLPWVCMNCHGGTYEPENKGAPTQLEARLKSNFLMFDLDSFEYSDRMPRDAQEEAFYLLNQMVKTTRPPRAVSELIDGWYSDGSHRFDGDFLPSSWEGQPQADLYRNFVAPACRSCHVSQEGLEWDVYRDQDESTQTDVAQPKVRTFIRLLVCGTNHMPHARPTYTRFWTSEGPHQPTFLADYQDLSVGWSPFEDCE